MWYMEHEQLKHYLSDLTGIKGIIGELKPIDITKLNYPRLVLNYYDFYRADILDQNFTWAVVKNKRIEVRHIRAHLRMIKNTDKLPTVFVFESLGGFQQRMLMSLKINFVVQNRTVFLPDALIVLKKSRSDEKAPPIALSTWGTMIILFQLNNDNLEGNSISDIAELFGISTMHASRAVEELKTAKLVTVNQQGVYKKLQFHSKKELWSNALPYLKSPVVRKIYCNESIEGGRVAGYSALGKYTLIESGEQKTVAISKKQFAKTAGNLEIKNVPAEFAKFCIEIWEWSPEVIEKGKYVDQLSLYLSMRDNAGDRTQIALKEILENVIGA